MSKIKTVLSLSKTPLKLVSAMGRNGLLNWMPDRTYLKLVFFCEMNKRLNLKKPMGFNEKLQWLKLYNRDPVYSKMVDKYEVKKHVANFIGKGYIIPTIGVWDFFDDIDFDKLPNQFVLKCTHDSGSVVICRDKFNFDKDAAKAKINKGLKNDLFWYGREWPYKGLNRKIIAEEYIEDSEGKSTDYKFFCFNGKVDSVMLCLDRQSGDTKFYFFDKEWNLKRYNKLGLSLPEDFTLPKPNGMDEMFDLAEKLAGYCYSPFVRIDLYNIDGRIYFGEYTFFPDSGFDANLLKKTDEYFGSLIELEK